MFTGIVEELGKVVDFTDGVLRIGASTVLDDAKIGDSISVNGCCLTVTRIDDDADVPSWWEADVSHETLSRTTLGSMPVGAPVNLERAVRASDRLGGHIVQGHVDAVGEVIDAVPDLRVRMPRDLLRYVVTKGSVTVDGVSLTVVEIRPDSFTVALVPHTAEVTTLGRKDRGDAVNLEVDVIAKYTERLLAPHLASLDGSDRQE